MENYNEKLQFKRIALRCIDQHIPNDNHVREVSKSIQHAFESSFNAFLNTVKQPSKFGKFETVNVEQQNIQVYIPSCTMSSIKKKLTYLDDCAICEVLERAIRLLCIDGGLGNIMYTVSIEELAYNSPSKINICFMQ